MSGNFVIDPVPPIKLDMNVQIKFRLRWIKKRSIVSSAIRDFRLGLLSDKNWIFLSPLSLHRCHFYKE